MGARAYLIISSLAGQTLYLIATRKKMDEHSCFLCKEGRGGSRNFDRGVLF